MLRRSILFIIIAISWTVLITVSSLLSFKELPSTGIEVSDKVIHGGIYFVFTVLWYLVLVSYIKRNLLLKIGVVSALYGIIIEVFQYLMPYGRSFEPLDIVANCCGILLGILAVKLFFSAERMKKKK
ncbi:VanZ like family protein [Zhouia amylolytica]|uniref:VanZ like family protein n=1 Tax=Zhouia amylolytica TaxID=376730 RepID=A0A1I6VD56_9FLAO|nr:VanZ family protein [Zhouia amylolytica]SFT11582.1 VanZ like family protein [Zhouia amylolytica]